MLALLPRSLKSAPSHDPSDSPLGQFLLHPGQTLRNPAEQLLTAATAVLQHVWPELLAVMVVLLAGIVARRAWQARRLVNGARCVTILVPPTVDPAGGQPLWANLHGLIRPSWRVRLAGQPHLAFELAWTPRRVQARLWVPGTVPPELVERVVASAWPGAQTQTVPPEPPLPLAGSAAGGELRLAQPEWYPLNLDQLADPLRAVFDAVGNLREGEAACVQVLARPVGARRLARSRRAARALRSGRSMTRAGRLLDLLSPGPSRAVPATIPRSRQTSA